MPETKHIEVTIPNGASVSNAFFLEDVMLFLVLIPATLSGYLGLQHLSLDGVTWDWMRDSGREGTTQGDVADINAPAAGWANYRGWYPFPGESYPAGWVRLATHDGAPVAGVPVAQVQTGAQTLEVKAKGAQ